MADEKDGKQNGEQFDVTIIGSGPGGYVAAIRAGQLGLKVAMVEKDTRLGGTCTLRGCIPTKQMLMSAHVYEQMQHAADFGVQATGIQLAFADVQKRKDKVVLKNTKGIEYLMKKNKVTVFKGTGKLALPGKVEVTGADGKKQTIETKNIIIATGSVVRPIPGLRCASRGQASHLDIGVCAVVRIDPGLGRLCVGLQPPGCDLGHLVFDTARANVGGAIDDFAALRIEDDLSHARGVGYR